MSEQNILPQLKPEIATQHEEVSPPTSLLVRWWIYQHERFPIFAHGVLIAAFSFCMVSYSSLVRGYVPTCAGALAFACAAAFSVRRLALPRPDDA